MSTTLLPVAERWFERSAIDGTVTKLTEPHIDPLLRANIWHVRGRDRDLLIDSGMGVASVRVAVADLITKPLIAIATHGHSDHVGCLHEFEIRGAHPADAPVIRHPKYHPLRAEEISPEFREALAAVGYPLGDQLITALPRADFDPHSFMTRGCDPTLLLNDGDEIDLGDRMFQVMHLPGHTPGCIALWDAKNALLFSGDVVYDGPLLDELPGSNIPDYIDSMHRLRELPAEVIHGGHDPSFGRTRFHEIIDGYLNWREQ